MQNAMRNLGFETPSSKTSVLVMKVPGGDAGDFVSELKKNGSLTRGAAPFRLPGYVSFSNGSTAKADHVISGLSRMKDDGFFKGTDLGNTPSSTLSSVRS